MLRLDLLKKLLVVSPALSTNTTIPVLTHLIFSGETLSAYNDRIGISVPFKSEFVGAVPALIIELLQASKAKDVELIAGDNELQMKAASARIKLAMLPDSQFVFEMPAPKLKTGSVDALLDAVECCMRSVMKNATVPDQQGVTVVSSDNDLLLYSTNNATMTRALVSPAPFKLKERVILSGDFCKQMLAIAKWAKSPKLEIHEDYALFHADGVSLFGNLIESNQPIDFEGLFEHHMPDDSRDGFIPIPTKLKLILDRAVIVATTTNDSGHVRVTVRDRKMKFVSKSGRGEITDSMMISEDHPDTSAQFKPEHLKAGYGFFDSMLITDSSAIMIKDNKIYLVSPVADDTLK